MRSCLKRAFLNYKCNENNTLCHNLRIWGIMWSIVYDKVNRIDDFLGYTKAF